MKPAAPERAWDVVIVDATGRPADLCHRLRGELVRRGLRVKLDIVPEPSVSAAPPEVDDDARRARYGVIFMTVKGDDGREETAYVAAPRYYGQALVFAPAGTKAPPGSIETGRIKDDVAGLAGRIAERLGSTRD